LRKNPFPKPATSTSTRLSSRAHWPNLAAQSTRGRQIIVAQSGYRMHEEAPSAIVAAVSEVLMDLRGEKARSPAGGSARR
jgi:hypothetical protein